MVASLAVAVVVVLTVGLRYLVSSGPLLPGFLEDGTVAGVGDAVGVVTVVGPAAVA